MKIAFVGTSGFPWMKNATISRLRSVAGELAQGGCEVFVLNRRALSSSADVNAILPPEIRVHEVEPNPQAGQIGRLLSKLLLPWREWGMLSRLNRDQGLDALHIYTQSFGATLLYLAFARIHRIAAILHYVELRSKIEEPKNLRKRINDALIDGRVLRWFDGVIAISGYLEEHVRRVAPRVATLPVPPICDFEAFEAFAPVYRGRPFFVYCGSAAYREVMQFILDSWGRVANKQEHELVIVTSGDRTAIEALRNSIDGESVAVLSGLPYAQLIGLYKGAKGLLIPLRPTAQDCARFPQKCCEYIASGGLMLSTNVGEVGRHFRDGESALLAKDFNVDAYADLIRKVLEDPDNCRGIALRGKSLGRSLFHSGAYGQALTGFFQEAIQARRIGRRRAGGDRS